MTTLTKLDRAEFEQWLAVQPAERTFDPGARSCPLACFLSDKNHGLSFHVTISQYATKNIDGWETLPDWASEFVFRFDKEVAYAAPEERNVGVASKIMTKIPLKSDVSWSI